ncbi:MAG TPA: hypothetical protein VFA20_30155 [Myxococcaceae bacterium]|nr:hypothetical protein [Myxococcaceae bacterium]
MAHEEGNSRQRRGEDENAHLRLLYQQDDHLRLVADYLASRERNAEFSTVDALCQRTGLGRGAVIDVLRLFEKDGFGDFIVGRRGQPSRFRWGVSMIAVGRAASGEPVDIDRDVDAGVSDGASIPMRTWRNIVRDEVPIELELPVDLTPEEAARLAKWIESLPLAPAASSGGNRGTKGQ